MTRIVARSLRCGAVWVWMVFAAALVLTAACTDLTVPRVTEQVDDTLQDSLSNAG